MISINFNYFCFCSMHSNCTLCTACYFLMTWLTIEFNDKYVFKRSYMIFRKEKKCWKCIILLYLLSNLLLETLSKQRREWTIGVPESSSVSVFSVLMILVDTKWTPKPGFLNVSSSELDVKWHELIKFRKKSL